jgi:hypothetical protein
MKYLKIMAVAAVAMSTVASSAEAAKHRYHHPRHHHVASVEDANGNLSRGLVTVPTAAGISITCSPGFASEASSLIATAVAHGIKFHRITCYSQAGTHVRGSNHRTGNAFDSHPSIPAYLVRQAGLRSGCDFHDCPHVDNARNSGGVAFWNSVKHRHYAALRHHRRNYSRYASRY